MTYLQALNTAEKSVQTLREDDGNLSEYELIVTLAGLDLALKEIAKRNHIILPR